MGKIWKGRKPKMKREKIMIKKEGRKIYDEVVGKEDRQEVGGSNSQEYQQVLHQQRKMYFKKQQNPAVA